MDLDEVADELYEVVPEDFVAARSARQEEARAAGDKALAREIAALPKPSTAAWLCNVLVRHHRGEIESLVELGGLMREAQENLAGEQLRALNSQRSQLLSALTRQAAALARELGHPVSTSVGGQVEETLRAALADPDAGGALLSGRLTSPMSYSGLGTTGRPDLRLVRSPRATPTRRTAPPADRRRDRHREQEARRAAEEQRRRELEEARRTAQDAEADAQDAAAAAEEARGRSRELADTRDELAERIAQLRAELDEAERSAADVATDLGRAERRRRTAERAAADAAAARDRAVAHLAQLERGEEG